MTDDQDAPDRIPGKPREAYDGADHAQDPAHDPHMAPEGERPAMATIQDQVSAVVR
jgi:hypothetical protein